MVDTHNSQQTCRNYAILNGTERMDAVAATCSIRPGRGLNISVDVMCDLTQADETDRQAIADAIAAYLAEELTKAAGLGIPVRLPDQN